MGLFKTISHKYRLWKSERRERDKEKRSDRWPTVRDHYLKDHPRCASCGSSSHVQVHHRKPFHLYPELELEDSNLITLCMDKDECHLRIGHGDDFHAFNPEVTKHAQEALQGKDRARIEEEAKKARQY